MRADNSRHLIAAAHKRSTQTRRKAIAALRRMTDGDSIITFDSVAREAGISRSWLYAQPDLRAQIEQLRARAQRRPTAAPPDRQRATDTSLLRRLEAAIDRNKRLEQDNRQLRNALAQALGEQRQATITGRQAPGPRHAQQSIRD